MAKHLIRVNALSAASLKAAADKLQKYSEQIESCTKELVRRLSEQGLQISSAKYKQAQYAGTNDVSVSVEERGERKKAIIASGYSVLFIEFGTGVRNPDSHPEAGKFGFTHGTYGYGRGKSEHGWGYYGEVGANPPPDTKVVTNRPKGDVVHTYGNPAGMCMYETRKELEEMILGIAKEVFRFD